MKILTSICFLLLFSTTVFAGDFVNYSVDGQKFEGYYISPKAGSPLVLLIHDWDGLTEYEVKRAGMLAELGYSVFAADLFGAGVRPTKVEDKRQHTGELYKDREKMRALLNGALKEAAEQGASTDKVVAAGYCFGGAAVLEMARSGADVTGFVTFHGGLKTPAGQDYSEAKGSFLIFHGTADNHITMEHFANLATELEEEELDHEMISYGGAPHAFTVYSSKGYQEAADKKSWKRFTEYLAETL